MVKNNYFYFDLDGTLLNDQKEISTNNLKVLKKLKMNNKIGIITGRPYVLIKKILNETKPNLPTITINGALILKNNKIFSFNYINSKLSLKIINFLLSLEIDFLAYTIDKIFYKNYKIKKRISIIKKNAKENKFDLKDINFYHKNEKIYKFLCIIQKKEIEKREMIKKFINNNKNVYFVKSQSNVLDIMPIGSSKGNALEKISNDKIIDLKKTIVFGDADNDISMFEKAGISVAMNNSNNLVKSKATFSTNYDNNEDGIANFLRNKKYV